MILTVTLNAALDVTYEVAALSVDQSHRVEAVHTRAGGKGLNVARVLDAFGYEVAATGLLGGPTGAEVRRALAATGVTDAFTDISAESRRTVTVVGTSEAGTTSFNEPGPVVTTQEWQRLLTRIEDMLPVVSLLICSGSIPPGVPTDAYSHLCERAARYGIDTLVDADGPALRHAMPRRPMLVKPNAEELAAATGTTDPWAGASMLREIGAQAVVTSRGPDGLIAVTEHGRFSAKPPAAVAGNATGAGDACVAALAAGAVESKPWPQRLCDAVAWSTAAVHSPTAGDVDPHTARGLQGDITVEEIHAPDTDR